VAHELNNPLTGVLGQAQLILDVMPTDDPNRRNVEKIERAAQRCRKIVRSLLDFSRPQDYNFRACDVDELVQSSLSFCESEIAAMNISVIWEKNPVLPKIWASDNHLQQVFMNIITNAMQAMSRGGMLTIRTDAVGSEDLIPIEVETPGSGGEGQNIQVEEKIYWVKSFVEIGFTDTGSGIDKEHLSRIFDPFFTTKDPGKGTGLGLSVSYGIVKKHKGQIAAASDGLGYGSVFSVRIPVAPAALEENSPDGA
jgi:signal transduction histidine kinase